MLIRRTSNRNSGWGVSLRWRRAAAPADWLYWLEITGIQHPGAWSRFTLRIRRDRGSRRDLTVETAVFGDTLYAVYVGNTFVMRYDDQYTRINGSTGIGGMMPFWKLAQGARWTKDGGAAMALIDWLCEKEIPLPGGCGLTELLMEGVPGVGEVAATGQAEQLGDPRTDPVGDQRVAPV